MNEALSLADLHDIVLPQAPPLWPPAAGFWVLLLVAVVLVFSAWRLYRRMRHRNAYRRFGLAELRRARTVHEVSVILKRVALAAWPREQVASLYGRDWVGFLNAHGRGCRFDERLWRQPEGAADPALRDEAARWIRRHRAGVVETGA